MVEKNKNALLVLIILLLFTLIPLSSESFETYIIGEEDVLDIFVWNNVDLSRKVIVRPDGMISLPLVNDVKAKGLTAMQLRDVLVEKISAFVDTLDLTVTVDVINSFKVYVIVKGKGGSTGTYTLKRKTLLLQFFASIGGIEEVDLPRSYVLRENKKIDLDMERLFYQNDLSQNIELMPNDTLVLQDRYGLRISVIGEIKNPGIIGYRRGMTLLDVILDSGGLTDYARPSGTKIIRRSEGGNTIIKVDLDDILYDGEIEKNIFIEPGDTVIVPKGFL